MVRPVASVQVSSGPNAERVSIMHCAPGFANIESRTRSEPARAVSNSGSSSMINARPEWATVLTISLPLARVASNSDDTIGAIEDLPLTFVVKFRRPISRVPDVVRAGSNSRRNL